ncbi:trigger factor [Undibacterium arcticum]
MAGYPKIVPKAGDDVAEGSLAFDATFEIYPEVKIGELAGVEVEKGQGRSVRSRNRQDH